MNKIHKNYMTKQDNLGYLKYGLVIWHSFLCGYTYLYVHIHTHKYAYAYVYLSNDFVCDKYIEHLS